MSVRLHHNPYKGDVLDVFNDIQGDLRSYTVNKVYRAGIGQFWFYINQRGYMHILKPQRVRFNEERFYVMVDYLLTVDNMLREINHSPYYTSLLRCIIETLRQYGYKPR